ncbi:AAA-like domain-containing protein [Oscillatoria sp. CS-180]|uniref:AAA-like domain-containing protein n=1 Tax=Oscillatoria sp. CS-180 TaxID=3021720 RepID=UPI00232F15B8|nr:AAA-like domain-containing protein [Oscillatoria sp. CS-180]MDB9527524.1 AAA-like domain-containing protein [Oscillatoria sp. CS-180]
MDADSLVHAVEELLQRRLEALERFVLCQSWLKRTYAQMAHESSYGPEYVKQIGSKLWSEISVAMNETVSKKNIHLVFTPYFQNLSSNQQPSSVQTGSLTAVSKSSDSSSEVLAANDYGDFTVPSGPVPLNSSLYIQRLPLETIAFHELEQPGCLLKIKAPRRMGKSSLLNRLLAHSSTRGHRTVKLNLQEVDEACFASLDKFLRWFCANLSGQLGLPSQVDALWDDDMGSKVNCKLYIERCVLANLTAPLVLGIDELNRIFEYAAIANDFLPMVRVWYEQSKDDSLWQKLRLVLVHGTDFYVPLKINQSPFNVGLSIVLPSFTLAQLHELAHQYGLTSLTQGQGPWHLKALHHLTNGHPYLASLVFYALQQPQTSLAEILETAATPIGIYRQHLQRYLATLQSDPELADVYSKVVNAEEGVRLDAIAAYRLESFGLIRFENDLFKPACELYRLYFQNQLAASTS